MKIFCTGASGYIGGSVAAHLAAAGHQVTGLVRSADKADAVRAFGIAPVMGTLDDGEILAQAAQAADVVVNAASADHKGAVVVEMGKGDGLDRTVTEFRLPPEVDVTRQGRATRDGGVWRVKAAG